MSHEYQKCKTHLCDFIHQVASIFISSTITDDPQSLKIATRLQDETDALLTSFQNQPADPSTPETRLANTISPNDPAPLTGKS